MNSRNDICSVIQNSIVRNELSAENHFLVAVSGGVDSMVLLAALKQIADYRQIKLTAVHLDHMYRGDAAIEDAHLVRSYCQKLGVACHIYRRPIERLAKNANKSFEEMARIVRYRLFRALKHATEADYIVTAHHLDDLAESVLLHLMRGSGIAGLVGIKPLDGDLFRPLLKLTKVAIENFAKANKVPYNDDISNDDTYFLRNKIRHQLIPQLAGDYNCAIVNQLAQLSDIVRLESDYLAADTVAFFDEVVTCGDEVILDVDLYKQAHTARRRRLIRHLYKAFTGSNYNLAYKHVVMLDAWLQDGVINSRQTLAGLNLLIDRNGVNITLENAKKHRPDRRQLTEGVNTLAAYHLTIMISEIEQIACGSIAVLTVPSDFKSRGLAIRNRQAGDFVRLKGLKGKRKSLKKLLNEQSIAIAERANLPLLACGSEILWGKRLRKTIYQTAAVSKNNDVCYIYIDDM